MNIVNFGKNATEIGKKCSTFCHMERWAEPKNVSHQYLPLAPRCW